MLTRHLSVAPMMDYTDRHCRYFHRLLSKKAVLYTEMITTGAILKGPTNQLLAYHPEEHPVALQLGGSDPKALAISAKIGENYGYDEINLNIGCPSNRVKEGRFGACLMAEPELVGECVAAMSAEVEIPITVKTRIGIDNNDSYQALTYFIQTVAKAGCKTFIIHARSAILSGLSPKENREIPPLRYDIARQLKQDLPALEIILNGGITSLDEAKKHLREFDGIMIGRAAFHNPYLLSQLEQVISGTETLPSRIEVLRKYLTYLRMQLTDGVPFNLLVRPIFGLFQGQMGARAWRRGLSECSSHKTPDSVEKLLFSVGSAF